MSPKTPINTGDKFGRLTVTGEAERQYYNEGKNSRRMVNVVCDCGTAKTVRSSHLTHDKIKSCGCLVGEALLASNITHGMSGNAAYGCWSSMHKRCRDEENYHGRGITVCYRWSEFPAFLEDMGERPSLLHSIERKDNNGNYEPGNCVWATRIQQQNNMRSNRLFEFYGITLSISAWSRISQVSTKAINHRLSRGWNDKKAIWKPPQARKAQS